MFLRRRGSTLLRLSLGAFCSFVVTGVATPVCWAQVPAAQRQALASLSQAARENLDPARFPTRARAEEQVIAAARGVSDYLAPRTDEENLRQWMQYIGTDPLIEAIQSDAPPAQIAAQAQRVRGRLIGNVDGLELAAMRRLRASTERLIASLRFEDPEAGLRLVDQQLDALARRLQDADDLASPDDAAALSTIIGLLQQSNQAPQVVEAVRGAFARPNLVLTVGGHVVEQAIYRDVNQMRPVCDLILGTTVVGNAALTGQVTGKLVPSHGQVRIDLILTGQLNSRTVGYNGPVRLPTVGRGFVTASRSLYVDEVTRTLSPTYTSATLKSTITSIDHPLRIVRRIAQRQIDRNQPQAERIATRRFRMQVASDFDRQTTEAVRDLGTGMPGPGQGRPGALLPVGSGNAQAPTDRIRQTRITLARLNLSEPARTLGSTSDSIYIHAVQRAETQLAAANAPPPIGQLLAATGRGGAAQPPGQTQLTALGRSGPNQPPYQAAIQIHESAIDNAAAQMLAGRTITGKQIDLLLAMQDPKPLDLLLPPPEPEPFEIDFSSFRPVILELRDQSVRVGIRGTRFSQGEREIARPLEITAVYRPEQGEDGTMFLRRDGGVNVDFPGPRRLTVQQVALRRAIQRTFENRFPETLLDKPILLPQAGAMFGVNTFQTDLFDARDGWATVTIR